ncbi:MAG: hypothetical protein P8Y99_01555 [Calditrichaceae bacterium]
MRLLIILSLFVSIISASERDEIKSPDSKTDRIVDFNIEKFSLMHQSEDSVATSSQTLSKKRGIHAALMSAAIPGLGEVYAKSYWRAAIFFALDAVLLTSYFVYDGKGEDEDKTMKAFGDLHWSERKYWSKVYDLALSAQVWEDPVLEMDPDNPRIISEDEFQNTDVLKDLRSLENATEIGYTHTLPTTQTQQYYEMIYKYLHQFGVGWDDITKLTIDEEDPEYAAWIFYDSHANLGRVTPNIKKYRAMRNQSNDYYQTATTMLNLMLLNHVLSAFDAALAVKQFNKKINYAVRVNSQFDGIEQVTTYGLNVSW